MLLWIKQYLNNLIIKYLNKIRLLTHQSMRFLKLRDEDCKCKSLDFMMKMSFAVLDYICSLHRVIIWILEYNYKDPNCKKNCRAVEYSENKTCIALTNTLWIQEFPWTIMMYCYFSHFIYCRLHTCKYPSHTT